MYEYLSTARYTLPLIIAAVFAIAITWRAMPYGSRGGSAFAWMMAAISWWLVSYALELNSDQLAEAMLWGKAEYLAIVAIPPLWLLFVLRYSNTLRALSWRGAAALAAIPALTLLLVWTNEGHGLVWSEVSMRAVDGAHLLAISHGPWFWLQTIYAYALMVSGSFLLIRATWRSGALYRRQAFILTGAALTPLTGNIVYLLGLSPLPHLDLTPFLFTVTGGLCAWGIYRTHLLAIVPFARNMLLDEMSDGVVVIDSRGVVADLNPAARRLLGCPGATLLGQPLAAAAPTEQLRAALYGPDGSGARAQEVMLGHGEDERALDVRLTPLMGWRGRSNGHLIVLRDITDRKRAERDLRILYERQLYLAEQAEAGNRAKSAFIANMSHELRTPLTAILGFSDLLVDELADHESPKLAADLAHIRAAGLHLLDLVNNILTLASIEASQMQLHIEPVDVKAVVMSAVSDARPMAARGQNTFTAKIADNLGSIETDSAKLLQILQHVLSNACKFTEGGYIVLDAYRERALPHDDEYEGLGATERVVFQVSDTGIGMTADQIDAIFADFSQVDSSQSRRYGGLGLGLSLTRNLCHCLGGTIRVSSAPGHGSVFTMCLPVTKPGGAPASVGREPQMDSRWA